MQVELCANAPPSPISQRSELRRITDEELDFGARTEQNLFAPVALAADRWPRTTSTHRHTSLYQVPCTAKNAEPVAPNDTTFGSTPDQENRHPRFEAFLAHSYVDQEAVHRNACHFDFGDVSGEAPGVLCRNRNAETCFIPGTSHPIPIHDGPISKLQVPQSVPSRHITSLQSPPASPNASLSDAKENFETNAPVKVDSSRRVASSAFPLVSTPSHEFLKRRRASTTAMYDYQHGTNTSYNDDNTMKRSKSSSTAICHPKKRKLSASFIKSIENNVLYPIHTPRASSTCSYSSESSAASNYSCSASSSQEDLYKPRPERRHHCQLCSASFARGHDLRRHERTHSNIRDHKCTVCGREFSRRDALQRHIAVCDGQRKAGKKNSKTGAKNVSAGPVSRKTKETK